MMRKIYVLSGNVATFVCPKCGRSKNVDVSRFMNVDKEVIAKYRCKCGYAESVLLERRKVYRKDVRLPGAYVHYISGKKAGKGLMDVTNISRNGLRIQTNGILNQNFNVGDQLMLEFHLNDRPRTFLNLKVAIKTINKPCIGAELRADNQSDRILGFYLLKSSTEEGEPL
jgi:predicted RNA-binding Zn-ribbon protein involved in translation (DUF1610 family)